MPHCAAPCARKARRSRSVSRRGPGPRPSIIAPSACARRHEAGAGLRAVEQHRAGAAIAGLAADLGAGQSAAGRAACRRASRTARRCDARRLAVEREAQGRSSRPAGGGSSHAHAALRLLAVRADRRAASSRISASRRAPADSRPRRGCRRSATSCATCSGRTMSAQRPSGCPCSARLERRQPLGTAEQAPTARRARAIASVRHRLDDARRHHDRDHQIAARAELEERAARPARASGTRSAVTISSAPACRVPIAGRGTRAPARAACRARSRAPPLHRARSGWAGRRPRARRCRDCRRACRGSGSARRRSRAPPASGRRTAAAARRAISSSRWRGSRSASAVRLARCRAARRWR